MIMLCSEVSVIVKLYENYFHKRPFRYHIATWESRSMPSLKVAKNLTLAGCPLEVLNSVGNEKHSKQPTALPSGVAVKTQLEFW